MVLRPASLRLLSGAVGSWSSLVVCQHSLTHVTSHWPASSKSLSWSESCGEHAESSTRRDERGKPRSSASAVYRTRRAPRVPSRHVPSMIIGLAVARKYGMRYRADAQLRA